MNSVPSRESGPVAQDEAAEIARDFVRKAGLEDVYVECEVETESGLPPRKDGVPPPVWEADFTASYEGFNCPEAFLSLHIDSRTGRLWSYTKAVFVVPESVSIRVTRAEAARIAAQHAQSLYPGSETGGIQVSEEDVAEDPVITTLYRASEGGGNGQEDYCEFSRLAWRARVRTDTERRPVVYVDCETGEVLRCLYY